MDSRKQQLAGFFVRYAERFNKGLREEIADIEGTAGDFSDCFIEASPAGVSCGKNDEQFRSAIPGGFAFYKKIGITSMNILSMESTLLDSFHAMTKIHWKSDFLRKNNSTGSIEFDVIYFTQVKENKNKVFAYITGDEQAAFKEKGLI